MISRFPLDVNTGRRSGKRETLDRKSEQSKLIVMGSVIARRTGTAIARSAKIIDCLFQVAFPARALGQRTPVGGNVVNSPMVPRTRGSVGVIAQQNKASGSSRHATPFERRREIFTVASMTAGNRFPVRKRARAQLHGFLKLSRPFHDPDVPKDEALGSHQTFHIRNELLKGRLDMNQSSKHADR
jgi:hypothetical protein